MNFRYPVFLDVAGKKCLVIGEGPELEDKAKALTEAGAEIVRLTPGKFRAADLAGCFLVITDQPDNSEVFRVAEEQGILCNSVDDPEHCRFSFGAVHRQGDLTIAISTNGWAPAVAVRLKERLQREIGPEYGELLELLKMVRSEITNRISDFNTRRELWYRIVDSDVLELLREGERDAAAQAIRRMIEEAISSTSRSGTSGDSVDR
ncbi:MAG TPA: bifunctional precorrin-2 dehydrogenase/sirohydrochlorin ferrochelatase [Bryobacteraceae bacterium]|jgi:siroheme synthase-like protein